MDENARKIVTKYVEDMHSLVGHGLQPISQQQPESNSRDHQAASQFIQRLHGTLQGHQSALDQALKRLGTSPTTGVQDAAAAVAGVAAGLYNQMRSEAVSKSLRDDYTFLSHCGVSWLMLMTTARSLGDHETEELAERGYRDCAGLCMDLDRLMPQVVVHELQQDGFSAQDVSSWAQGIVHGAWNRQTAGTPSGRL